MRPASGLPALIAARVLQGIGGAMMVPVGRLILFRRCAVKRCCRPPRLTMPALVGPVLGPPLGGFLTDAMSRRSVFWINVPFGLAGLLLSARLIPPAQGERPPAPDLTGMALVGLALTTLMVGVEMIGRGLLPGYVPPLCIAAGLLLSG